MLQLKGKHNTAKVFTDNVDQTTISQIIDLCNQEIFKESKIAIMPDCHAGKGCTIGTTITITDKVVPNLVGVDLGCGVMTAELDIKKDSIDFEKLDKVIREKVPSGFNIHDRECSNTYDVIAPIGMERPKKSMGTLGSGNHFIELSVSDSTGKVYLIVHTGSRNLGKQIAEHYQNLASETLCDTKSEAEKIIKQLKAQGRQSEIQMALSSIKKPVIRKDLAYLEGDNLERYLHDVVIAQQYATDNRQEIIRVIVKEMGWKIEDSFETVHNYIDKQNMILRKGAISAQADEMVLIPLNMRDGSILARGLGNPEWNCSAPHGAGRIMSRGVAKEQINLKDFQESMKHIWSSSVLQSTLDEAPMAYKPADEILSHIKDTVAVIDILKPLYNFKAN